MQHRTSGGSEKFGGVGFGDIVQRGLHSTVLVQGGWGTSFGNGGKLVSKTLDKQA